MIYLVQSYYTDKQDHPRKCLKIGYAKNIEERMKAYKTYNPSIQLLKTREGEYNLESFLHRYFDKYKLSDFNEWFIYKKEIIDKFDILDPSDEEIITREEYLEYIRKEIVTNIISETYKDLRSQIPNLLVELKQEFDNNYSTYSSLYTEFPEWECKEIIIKTLKFLRETEIDYFENYTFSDIIDKYPQIMGRQRLKENVFRDECIFIYKLSDSSVTMEEFNRMSKEKIRITMDDIKNGELLSTSLSKDNLINDIRLRIQVKKYKNDYTGIDEKTGLPKLNKLVLIAERRAFELRSDIYKTDVMIYNEFNNIQSVGISFEDLLEKSKVIDHVRRSFNSSGSFESKMRVICDLLLDPKWFGKIHISDLFWLPLSYRNYLNYLGPEKIKSKAYYEAEIKREIQNLGNEDMLRALFMNSFVIGEKLFLKDVKERIRKIYKDQNLQRTPKAVDLLNYFEVREYMSVNKETGKRLSGYEILKIKE